MGVLNWLGIGNEIAKPIEAVSKLYTTDKERLEAQAKLESVQQQTVLGQQEINKIFANSNSFFNSAWPSLSGWTAGACIALYYVPQLITANYIWIKICLARNEVVPFPLGSSDLIYLVSLMFGFGGYQLVKRKMD